MTNFSSGNHYPEYCVSQHSTIVVAFVVVKNILCFFGVYRTTKNTFKEQLTLSKHRLFYTYSIAAKSSMQYMCSCHIGLNLLRRYLRIQSFPYLEFLNTLNCVFDLILVSFSSNYHSPLALFYYTLFYQ